MSFALFLGSLTGLAIFVSIMLAVITYQDEIDALERFILAGFAGSMLLTTPALWMADTPFDGWSFYVSRGFLAAFCVKRFFVPVLTKWRGDRRQQGQVSQSAARLHDRRRHWL